MGHPGALVGVLDHWWTTRIIGRAVALLHELWHRQDRMSTGPSGLDNLR